VLVVEVEASGCVVVVVVVTGSSRVVSDDDAVQELAIRAATRRGLTHRMAAP
jgi:hypothetical protein